MSKRSSSSSLLKRNSINEKYYAQDSNPSFNQFGKNYHFIDEEGRLYQIATRNNNIFDNEKFNMNKKNSLNKPLKCYKSNDNYIKFFVKLPNKYINWFFDKDLNKAMILNQKSLIEHDNKRFIVKIKSAFKKNEKRRTGTVFIHGLPEFICNEILNSK